MKVQLKPGEFKVIKPEVPATGFIGADVDIFAFQLNEDFYQPFYGFSAFLTQRDLNYSVAYLDRGHRLWVFQLDLIKEAAACTVLASDGYPETYEKGFPIENLEEAQNISGVIVFHAGTKMDNGQVLTSGGRVLNVCARGQTLAQAFSPGDPCRSAPL